MSSARSAKAIPSPRLNFAGDAFFILLASFVATMWRSHGRVTVPVTLATASVGILLWSLGARVLRHYDAERSTPRRPVGELALTSMLVFGVVFALFLARTFIPHYADKISLHSFAIVLWPTVLWLRVMLAILPGMGSFTYGPPEDVLIIGISPLGRLTGLDIRDGKTRRKVHGYLRFTDEAAHSRLPAKLLGTVDDLEKVLRERAFDEIYIAGNAMKHATEMQATIRICERYGIPFALPASHFRFDRARPAHEIRDGYVHYLTYEHKPVQMAFKRLFDLAASGFALIALFPLFFSVALIIKLTSKGPIFFKQERVGRYGAPFYMLKFRSMVTNAEELKAKLMAFNEQSGPVFKMKHDPRVTGIGRFIRKFSIDELPQLINILRGEMSIVGPRPPVPPEVAKYEPWQRRRLSVRPGLTCVWQVSGRNNISFEEWMYLDMQYIDHWNLKQDFQLILKTVPVVLLGRGAS